jgi:hypothetical protein
VSIRALPHLPRIGSGTVVTTGLLTTMVVLFGSKCVIGWDATWRSFDVTPLQPHFFDMHVPLDYAACALKGIDPYVPHSCSVVNFNIPPVWLWLGFVGLDGSSSSWLAIVIIACAAISLVPLFSGRPMFQGLIALIAVLSPSVMMGVERGNPDLLILALVGAASLLYRDHSNVRIFGTVVLIGFGFVLKLFPMFSVALAARLNRRTFLFAVSITVLAAIYLVAIFEYILLIRSNVPITFILSYGYKAPFLGWDHLRDEAGLKPAGLAETWLPICTSIITLVAAALTAFLCLRARPLFCVVADSVAGTAFLFGSGIYCGTFMLGTNFIYRLMFLLLCVPQLQDWIAEKPDTRRQALRIEPWLLAIVLAVLWVNGNANGHSTFLWAPQVFNWLLFFGLATVLIFNFLHSAVGGAFKPVTIGRPIRMERGNG